MNTEHPIDDRRHDHPSGLALRVLSLRSSPNIQNPMNASRGFRMRGAAWTKWIILFLMLAGPVWAQDKAEPNPLAPIEDRPGLPRVLIIGDSISVGYTLPVRELLKDKANVHRIPVNGGPTIRGLANLDTWLGTGKWDVIHFNWGLHDV